MIKTGCSGREIIRPAAKMFRRLGFKSHGSIGGTTSKRRIPSCVVGDSLTKDRVERYTEKKNPKIKNDGTWPGFRGHQWRH